MLINKKGTTNISLRFKQVYFQNYYTKSNTEAQKKTKWCHIKIICSKNTQPNNFLRINQSPWPTTFFPSTINRTTEEQLEGGPSKLCWSRSLGESQRSSGGVRRLRGETWQFRGGETSFIHCPSPAPKLLRVVVDFADTEFSQKKRGWFRHLRIHPLSSVHGQNPAPGDIGNTLALKCGSIHLPKFLCPDELSINSSTVVHKGCLGLVVTQPTHWAVLTSSQD